eukprot:snap_masked-scaffold_63-processed-gene-0.34-mRNA-1 protein AED:1.00 eAED:1.00 QI:0/0/0/0/1/1/2/0/849
MATPSVTQIDKGSDQYSRVEYLISLSLPPTYRSENLQIYSFTNTNLSSNFKHSRESNFSLPCWTSLSSLSKSTSISDPSKLLSLLSAQGFRPLLTPQGIRLFTGSFSPSDFTSSNNYFNNSSGSASSNLGFILSHANLGKSFVVDDVSDLPTSKQPNASPIPANFNSVYLALQNSTDTQDYRHEYSVFNTNQLLPLYFVSFSIIHFSSNKRLSQPQVEPDKFRKLEFFDPVAFRAISAWDKMFGEYSTGKLASRRLLPLEEAWEEIKRKNLEKKSINRKVKIGFSNEVRALENELERIDEKVEEVRKNAEKVEKMIYDTMNEALEYLQKKVNERMGELMGMEVCVRRQIQQADFIHREEDYDEDLGRRIVKMRCDELLRKEYIKQSRYVREDLNKTLDEIQPDIKLVGGIEVVSKPRRHEKEIQEQIAFHEQITSPSPKARHIQSQTQIPPPPPPPPQQNQRMSNPGLLSSSSFQQPQPVPSPVQGNAPPGFRVYNPRDDVSVGTNSSRIPSVKLPSVSSARGELHAQHLSKFLSSMVLSSTPLKFANYSLNAEGIRKARQMKLNVNELFEMSHEAFEDSRVMSITKRTNYEDYLKEVEEKYEDEEDVPLKLFSQAQRLFLSLPYFRKDFFPETKLIFASWLSARSQVNIPNILAEIKKQQQQQTENKSQHSEDSEESVEEEKFHTLIIIKARDQVFGVYLNDVLKSGTCGTNQSFLFNLTQDVKFPFHGRQIIPSATSGIKSPKTKRPKSSTRSDIESESESSESDESETDLNVGAACRVQGNVVEFGLGDLVLKGDLTTSSSELEHTFGVGLNLRSAEDKKLAQTFLAGSKDFRVDEIEVWALFEES